MTILELKEKKYRIEKEIAEKLDEFEEETGVVISNIDIVHNWALHEPTKIEVYAKVKL